MTTKPRAFIAAAVILSPGHSRYNCVSGESTMRNSIIGGAIGTGAPRLLLVIGAAAFTACAEPPPTATDSPKRAADGPAFEVAPVSLPHVSAGYNHACAVKVDGTIACPTSALRDML
jgi:hypothetical protein